MLFDKIVSDGTVFLQGKYISMAVGNTGALGTSTATPTGVNAYKLGEVTNLGLYADLDGFGTGKASTMQDAVAMGAIIERFNIGYNIDGTKHIEGNMQFGISTITNGVSKDLSDATAARAAWTGTTDDKLKVAQVMTLTDDAKYVKVEITLTNQSASAMTDVRYMRSIDPDQDTSYKDLIKVVEQGGDGSNGALIAAYQPNGKNPFFYYTADDRAKVSTYNMINRDPYADKAYLTAQAEGYSVTADQAINLTFAAGTLAAGASTKLVLYMGLTDDLTATLAQINSGDTAPPPPAPVDLAPIAAVDSFSTINTKNATGNVLTNDKDPEGKALSASLVNGPTNGTLKFAADGSFVYTPKAGFVGTDAFSYAASDGKLSTTANISLNVTAPPPPTVKADTASGIVGQPITGNVLSNDQSASGVALTATLASGAAHGTVTLAKDGSFIYVSDAGFTGSDAFTYNASDGGASSKASVQITVAAKPNVAPVAVADNAGTVDAGSSLTGNVLANDIDQNGDRLTASLATGPTHGTLALAANGSFTYTAATGYAGADSFTYVANDGKASSTATVSISVTTPVSALDKLLAAHNTVDGSSFTSDVFTGIVGHNAFYIDLAATSGKDTIANFDGSDVLILNSPLADSNGDGIISFGINKLKLDGTTKGDLLGLPGIGSLRYLGEATEGAHIYAEASVKPKGALESLLGNDVLTGDATDKKAQKFFFDTALGFDLGNDIIRNMGKRDVVVTTTALNDPDGDHITRMGSDSHFDLGMNHVAGDAGHVAIFDTFGAVVTALELDGSLVHDGVTYYVYSLIGSTGSIPTLGF